MRPSAAARACSQAVVLFEEQHWHHVLHWYVPRHVCVLSIIDIRCSNHGVLLIELSFLAEAAPLTVWLRRMVWTYGNSLLATSRWCHPVRHNALQGLCQVAKTMRDQARH